MLRSLPLMTVGTVLRRQLPSATSITLRTLLPWCPEWAPTYTIRLSATWIRLSVYASKRQSKRA